MDSSTLKIELQKLQEDVVSVLQEVSELMNYAHLALDEDSNNNKYKIYQNQISDELKKVQNFELRMAIVAPMKAGKSTIINAIIGKEILPSRNSAMTTIPTEIVFDAVLNEPILSLSTETVSVFKDTLLSLRYKIEDMGLDQVQEKLSQYPHLIEIPKQILNSTSEIPNNSKGHENIIQTLAFLNDIVRLCSILKPSADPIQNLTDAPRIRTSFWRADQSEIKAELGNLVIVDTPGPNEAGENLRLKAVVAEQLRKSSIVLIVLDFTQLKNEAAEKVKEDVKKVINLLGEDNLYVLINKIDQRRSGDMTTEQVQQFVTAEFGISNSNDKNHIFEVSARRAFISTSFFIERQQQELINITESKAVRSLAEEVFIDWEDELKQATLEELELKAQRLWNKSGFDKFLNGAISALMAAAAPKTIISALKIARYRLSELNNNVQLSCSAVSQDSRKIKEEIEYLNLDLNVLEERSNNLKSELELIKKTLNSKLNSKLKNLHIKATKSIEYYFLDEMAKRIAEAYPSNPFEKFLKVIENIQIALLKTLLLSINIPLLDEVLQIVPTALSHLFKYEVVLRNKNELEFKNKQEAEDFSERLVSEAKQIVETLLNTNINEIQKEISNNHKHLHETLRKNTFEVIEKARNRLNQDFTVELDLPALLSEDTESVLEVPLGNNVEVVEDFNVLKVIVNFFKGLFDNNYTSEKDYRYIVSLPKTVDNFNKSIENKITKIEQEINQYLEHEFENRISNFIYELEKYLKNYQNNLKQALKAQSLSHTKQQENTEKFQMLASEAKRISDKLSDQESEVKRLISSK